VVDEYEDRMIVGEVYLLDLRQVVEYINSGDELHLAHNFVFVHLPWDAAEFQTSVGEFERLAERDAWPAWFLENHDHSRVPTRYGAGAGRPALMLVCALRGTAFVFQGEELGLPDAVIPANRIADVDGRDGERAPLPWRSPSEAGPGAGFTTGTPWLPIVADAERLSVARQIDDPSSTLSFARQLIQLRSRTPALQAGAQRSVEAPKEVLCFERSLDGERLLVAINFSSKTVTLTLDAGLQSAAGAELLLSTDLDRTGGRLDLGSLELGPDEGVIIRCL
jgi:alpha-glucosidase